MWVGVFNDGSPPFPSRGRRQDMASWCLNWHRCRGCGGWGAKNNYRFLKHQALPDTSARQENCSLWKINGEAENPSGLLFFFGSHHSSEESGLPKSLGSHEELDRVSFFPTRPGWLCHGHWWSFPLDYLFCNFFFLYKFLLQSTSSPLLLLIIYIG